MNYYADSAAGLDVHPMPFDSTVVAEVGEKVTNAESLIIEIHWDATFLCTRGNYTLGPALTTCGRNNPRIHRTAFHICGCECSCDAESTSNEALDPAVKGHKEAISPG